MLSDLVARWLETHASELKDYRQYLIKARTIAVFLRRPITEAVEVADAIKADGRRRGSKPGTINRKLAILRRVCTIAFREWRLVDTDYGQLIRLTPGEEPRHVYLTPDQVQHLAASVRKYSPVAADMVLFAAMSGLRRAELRRVQPGDIVKGVLLLNANTKSGRPRAIPLPPEARRIAKQLPWSIGDAALRFAFEHGRADAGLPHVHFHDLRHTYASWLIQAGEPTAVVRDLLGHGSVQTTNRYLHLATAHHTAAVRKLPKLRVRRGSDAASS